MTSSTDRLQKIEARLEAIERRNQNVEIQKGWETSWPRRLSVAFMVYLVVLGFFWLTDVPTPWFGAMVPSMAFLMSSFSLQMCRHWWYQRFFKNK